MDLASRLSRLGATFRSRLGKHIAVHTLGQVVFSGLGLVFTVLLTHAISVQQFGSYVFVIATIILTNLLFEFGLFSAGARVIAVAENELERRRRTGAIVLYGLRLGLAFAVFIATLAILVLLFGPLIPGKAVTPQVGWMLLMASPLILFFPLLDVLAAIAQGANRIPLLSLYTASPRILMLMGLGLLLLLDGVTSESALLLSLLSYLVSGIWMAWSLKPIVRGISEEKRLLLVELREFGRQVYYGRIVDGLTNGLDKVLLSLNYGMATGGVYSIALTLSSPISMVSRGTAISGFSRFAREPHIPRSIRIGNALWCVFGAVTVMGLALVLVPILFPQKYDASLKVLPLLAVGAALAGMNSPYNSFLQAQRRGRAVKIMSITTSLLSIGINVLLIPLLGMLGAGLAMITCHGVNILMNLVYYQRHFSRMSRMNTDPDPSVSEM